MIFKKSEDLLCKLRSQLQTSDFASVWNEFINLNDEICLMLNEGDLETRKEILTLLAEMVNKPILKNNFAVWDDCQGLLKSICSSLNEVQLKFAAFKVLSILFCAAVNAQKHQILVEIYKSKVHLFALEAIKTPELRYDVWTMLGNVSTASYYLKESCVNAFSLFADFEDEAYEAIRERKLSHIVLYVLANAFAGARSIEEKKFIWNIYSTRLHEDISMFICQEELTQDCLLVVNNAFNAASVIHETSSAWLLFKKSLLRPVCDSLESSSINIKHTALLILINIGDTTNIKDSSFLWELYKKLHVNINSLLYNLALRANAIQFICKAMVAADHCDNLNQVWNYYKKIDRQILQIILELKEQAIKPVSLFVGAPDLQLDYCNALYPRKIDQFMAINFLMIMVIRFLHINVSHACRIYEDFLEAVITNNKINSQIDLKVVIESFANLLPLGHEYENLWVFTEYDWNYRFNCSSTTCEKDLKIGIPTFATVFLDHITAIINSIGTHLLYSRLTYDSSSTGAIATVGLLSFCEDRNKQMRSPLDDLAKLKASYDDGISDLWCHYLRLYPSKFKNFEHLPSNKKPDFGTVVFKPWLWTSWWKLTRQWEQAKNPDGWKNQVENIATRQRQWLLDSWCDAVRIDAKGIRSPERLLLALWLCDWWNPNAERDFSAVAKWDDTRPWKDKAFREKLDLKALTSLFISEDEPLDGVKTYSRQNCEKGTPASMINVWNDDKQTATDAVIGLSLSLSNNEAWRESVKLAMSEKNFDQLEKQLDQAYSEVQLEASRVLNLLITMRDSTLNQSFRKKVNKWIGTQEGELIGRLVLGAAAGVMDDIICLENGQGDILSETLPESKDTYLDGISVLERRIGQMKQWHPGWQPSTDEKQKRGWMEPLSLHEWSALLLDAAPVSTAEPEALWYALERQRAILAVFSNDNKDVLALDEDAYKELFASLNSNADYTTDRSWPALEILKAHLEKIMPPIQWEDVAESLGEDVLIQLFWHSSGGEEQLSALILDQGKLVISQGSIQSRDWREKVQSLLDLKDEDLPDEFAQIVTWLNQMRRDGCKQRVIFPPDLEGIPFEALGANIIREISVHSILRTSDCSDSSDSQGSFVASLHKREGRFLLPAVECNHVATTIKQSTGTDPELIFERVGIVHLLEQFSKRRWIHLNAHGYYNRKSPLDSHLSLGKGEALPLWLLTGHRISSKVIVLSSCSGLRRELAQDDNPEQDQSKAVMSAIGIGGAMRAAGAQCVVGALYPVDERTAALWMGKFYKHLSQGKTVGEAVNQAREWMMNVDACEIKQEIKGLIFAITEQEKGNNLSQRIDGYIKDFTDKRKIIAGSFVILGNPKIKL